jgi:hypothetical protein
MAGFPGTAFGRVLVAQCSTERVGSTGGEENWRR